MLQPTLIAECRSANGSIEWHCKNLLFYKIFRSKNQGIIPFWCVYTVLAKYFRPSVCSSSAAVARWWMVLVGANYWQFPCHANIFLPHCTTTMRRAEWKQSTDRVNNPSASSTTLRCTCRATHIPFVSLPVRQRLPCPASIQFRVHHITRVDQGYSVHYLYWNFAK